MAERLTAEDIEVIEASLDIEKGGASAFTEYYFGVKLLPHQLLMAHAQQKSLLTLGGRGSGKTFGWAFVYIWLCTINPDFRTLWGSFSADQAAIPFNDIIIPYVLSSDRFAKFLPEGERSLKRKPYPILYIKIPGMNVPSSWIRFQTMGREGSSKRGFTLDAIHYDEGGLEFDPKVITTLRPALRGHRYDGTPRLGRFSVCTTPTDSEWLKEWWERANNSSYVDYSPDRYFALRVASSANTTLTPEQLEAFWQDMSPEERQVEIQAEFPEYHGSDFSPKTVNLCQDNSLNAEVDEMVAKKVHGADLRIIGKAGCVLYQKPVILGHQYILSGDPGTANPPYRNSAVIMVWDVTEKPYELTFFEWVAGDGDYRPFFRKYEWCWHYYRPVFSVFDATGTQRAMDQLYFEDRSVYVEGLSVTTEKAAMINAAKILMQKGFMRFPYIKGMRSQLLNYRMGDDRKLAQDIVMTLVMAAHKMRILSYQDADTIGQGEGLEDDHEYRYERDETRIRGRAA